MVPVALIRHHQFAWYKVHCKSKSTYLSKVNAPDGQCRELI